jgi:nucleotide-binding universal stress UspA family protein
MWLTKKILVATDFAEPSRAAADAGLELAQMFHVPLVLVHAYQLPSYVYTSVPFVPVRDYLQAYEEGARESLEKEKARVAAGIGMDVIAILREGAAWEEVLSTAKQVDAGLIVMGTHGRHGLPRALLGSVAEKVVRLSPIPVLTIHGADASHATVRGKAETDVRPQHAPPAPSGR